VYLPESDEVIVSTHVKFTCESTNDISEPIEETHVIPVEKRRRKSESGSSIQDFNWLVNTRHIDDEDHLLYETTRVYTYKGDIVCDRLRVNGTGELVTNGYDGPYHVRSMLH